MSGWKPGDRVLVLLPDQEGSRGYKGRNHWYAGTVREVDPPGLPAGVRLALDECVNGTRDCFATHAELRPDSGDAP